MSSFAVFGYSRRQMRDKLLKVTKCGMKESEAEWVARVDASLEEQLQAAKAGKGRQVSEWFDAPQFAQQYIELGVQTGDILPGAIVKSQNRVENLKTKRGSSLERKPWTT